MSAIDAADGEDFVVEIRVDREVALTKPIDQLEVLLAGHFGRAMHLLIQHINQARYDAEG